MEYVENDIMPKGAHPCWVICPYCGVRYNLWKTAVNIGPTEKIPMPCPNPDCKRTYNVTKGGACLVAVKE